MADITHGTWIKDGKAVDAAYQDGRQVYGRNLLTDSGFESGEAPKGIVWGVGINGTSGQPGADGKTPYMHVAYANSSDDERNMNNWVLTWPARQATTVTYKDGVNTIDYKGVPYYEVFNFPIKAKKGQSFTFSFSWTQPDVESLDGSDNGVPVSIADVPIYGNQIGRNVIWLGVSKTNSKLFTISGTATADTTYVSINLGYLSDGIQWQFKASFQQDFSQDPGNHEYMGWYSDFTATDSNDPSQYIWSLIKGADGADIDRSVKVIPSVNSFPHPFGRYMLRIENDSSDSSSFPNQYVQFPLPESVSIKSGETWTYSYYYAIAGSAVGQAYDYLLTAHTSPISGLSMGHDLRDTSGDQTTWHRFSKTWTADEDTTVGMLCFGFVKASASPGWLCIDNVKLAKEPTVLPWAPAPEDILN